MLYLRIWERGPWWIYPGYGKEDHGGYTPPVYMSWYHGGYTPPCVYAGYTTLGIPSIPHCPAVGLHVTDPPVRGVERHRGAQSGRNPWVREKVRVKVVIPVTVDRRECAELLRSP